MLPYSDRGITQADRELQAQGGDTRRSECTRFGRIKKGSGRVFSPALAALPWSTRGLDTALFPVLALGVAGPMAEGKTERGQGDQKEPERVREGD